MRSDVGIVIATADRRPEMLAVELESIAVAVLRVKAKGVRCEIVVEHDPDGRGVAATLATGLERTDARFTTFWGDDDVMLPDYLERHLAVANEGFDVVSGSFWYADAALNRGMVNVLPVACLTDFADDRCTVNDGALLRAETRLPLRPERGRAMMMTLWVEMLHAGRRFGTVSELTWLYRRHPGQLSAAWEGADRAFRDAVVAEARA